MSAVRSPRSFPLAARIAVAVGLAIVAGYLLGPRMAPFGGLGMVVVRLLKLLAGPLIFFAVVDSFLRLDIPVRKGAKLLIFSAINAVVATAIGLFVARLLGGGLRWRGHIEQLLASSGPLSLPHAAAPEVAPGPLGFAERLAQAVPAHLLAPFMAPGIVPLLVVAVGLGLAARSVRHGGGPEQRQAIDALGRAVAGLLAIFTRLLTWVVAVLPLAVFFLLAAVVGKSGVSIFGLLGWFLGTVVLGLGVHVLVYYPLLLTLLGRRSPWRFFREGGDAILTALSCGSSLASLPVTLRCLEDKLRVRPDSARLAACVGTNLNHDGIILYEAAAALFVTQALGLDLTLGQQLSVAGAAILAGIGIAGVPEAGLLTLPLVLAGAGVSDDQVARLLPLLFAVDWLIGRLRAATNVTSDMVVAVLLDRGAPSLDTPDTPDTPDAPAARANAALG